MSGTIKQGGTSRTEDISVVFTEEHSAEDWDEICVIIRDALRDREYYPAEVVIY